MKVAIARAEPAAASAQLIGPRGCEREGARARTAQRGVAACFGGACSRYWHARITGERKFVQLIAAQQANNRSPAYSYTHMGKHLRVILRSGAPPPSG